MKPSVGRIVLYTNLGDRDGKYPPEAQAAIITKVIPSFGGNTPAGRRYSENPVLEDPTVPEEEAWSVSLRIFYEDGEFIMRGVPFTTEAPASEGARGKWGWPPRV